ncbi:hypothetical protein BK025_08735 [Sodalis sp. TME1]|nr:hypothetical protein BK025_08735 [Sodalis sp. TME1]
MLTPSITLISAAVTLFIPSIATAPAKGVTAVALRLSLLVSVELSCHKARFWAPVLSGHRRLNEKFSFMNNLI